MSRVLNSVHGNGPNGKNFEENNLPPYKTAVATSHLDFQTFTALSSELNQIFLVLYL